MAITKEEYLSGMRDNAFSPSYIQMEFDRAAYERWAQNPDNRIDDLEEPPCDACLDSIINV